MRARKLVAVAAVGAAALGIAAFRSDDAPAAPTAAAAPAPSAGAPASASVPPASVPSPASTQPPATEDELMARLRAAVDVDPQAAVALAEDGDLRFPAAADADERSFLRMRALVHLDRIGVARDAARQFFERFPRSPLGRYVFRLTGMRPMPPLGPPR